VTSRPLKVRVAEALGGTVTGGPRWWRVTWPGATEDVPLPAFDTDERLGMRLLVRFGIGLEWGDEHPYSDDRGRVGCWAIKSPGNWFGVTPNHAICNLLLALGESGYLQQLLTEGGGTPWRT
jgi:hypothetical protein